MITPNFTPGKKYALDGATLQALFEAVGTAQILPSDEYEIQRDIGKGTRLKGIKAAAAPEERWDLIASGSGHIVRDPLVLPSYGSVTPIAITNAAVTLAADKWVVLTVNDLSADPYTLTLAVVDAESDGSLVPYSFNSSDVLTAARLPLHYLSAAEIPGAPKIGDLWALKYVSGTIQTLAAHHVIVPGRPISRPCPRLISL
jgi:hypothetical protein